jgi:rRNA maturation endonuclease Nob1
MTKKKKSRIGEVRCPNCFTRFRPPKGAEQAPCPSCGFEWYISWKDDLAKIRKPVWENWERQMTEFEQKEG